MHSSEIFKKLINQILRTTDVAPPQIINGVISQYPQRVPVSQEMTRVGKLLCHLYILLISIDPSNLNILNNQNIEINLTCKSLLDEKSIGHENNQKTYMWISTKIQLQVSLIVLPKIVYDYSCSIIFHR